MLKLSKKTFSKSLFKNYLKSSSQMRFYGEHKHEHGEKCDHGHDNHVDHHHAEYVPYNDGTKNNYEQYADGPLPEPHNFAVGIERYEIDKLAKGESLFNLGPDYIVDNQFGTIADPVIINSYYDERIVGCCGSEEEPHEILWHVVSEARPLVCLECYQVFKLNRLPDEAYDFQAN